MAKQSECGVTSPHMFPEINTELLIYTSDPWWKQPWRQIFKKWEHDSLVHVGIKLNEWQLVKILMTKLSEWKIPCIMEFLYFLGREFFFTENVH
jgi:hypothetical protein